MNLSETAACLTATRRPKASSTMLHTPKSSRLMSPATMTARRTLIVPSPTRNAPLITAPRAARPRRFPASISPGSIVSGSSTAARSTSTGGLISSTSRHPLVQPLPAFDEQRPIVSARSRAAPLADLVATAQIEGLVHRARQVPFVVTLEEATDRRRVDDLGRRPRAVGDDG